MRRKGKKNTQIDDKLIDEVVRMSYGFSEEQIRAEMEDALAHPDNSPELKAPDDEFQQILQKMKERGITPRISEDGDKDEGHPAAERGRTRLSSRRFRRLLLAAAVLGVIGIGFSLNAVGKSATKYQVINGEKNNIVWGNVKVWDGIDNVEEAYEQIEEELKILPLKMGYIPKEMVFEDLLLSESYGVMSFKYQAKSLWIYDHKIKNEVNGIQGSDREKSLDSVYNPWLNEKIEVYQEDSETGSFRYSVTIKTDDASYIVTGDIDKNEFLKVVEGLYINR
mgnify:FL=1